MRHIKTLPPAFSQEPAGSHELAGDDASPPHINDFAGDEDGIRLGSYQDCHYLASGVTAEVYRSGDRALKVIVEMRNIEPHNPFREAKILSELKKPCIPLLETFRDQEQRFTLVFPYMPLTLATLLERGSLTGAQLCNIFTDVFNALSHIHSQGIIHRDIKPSAFLLASPHGPVYLSDFGTAWHPRLSVSTEPANAKILDIGTGPYRAPEVLFGNKAYDSAVDMWGAGVMLADIFKTMGSPTRETWPEAVNFKTPPFEIYQVFERKEWAEILPDVDPEWRELVSALVRYDSARATAEKALEFPCLK
ncbi:putative cmgc cdk protein kinase protein [Phaeoacremonium minimum UCRPA7]|uniref:cyclin-dependent kinase n=1 Tax=Phaeoacremonium minimum (strain UCR-PA7) TaxID=1286976 RepID=R8BPA7_PHAM7|nr:putative cmgc cdk protein kinase protein [Phaeoacremonium minimum UCRPA7]EOO01130.1 putative cmgc cdk protein kinase protein [Phaeoacremonium minimum UCRPA7]